MHAHLADDADLAEELANRHFHSGDLAAADVDTPAMAQVLYGIGTAHVVRQRLAEGRQALEAAETIQRRCADAADRYTAQSDRTHATLRAPRPVIDTSPGETTPGTLQ